MRVVAVGEEASVVVVCVKVLELLFQKSLTDSGGGKGFAKAFAANTPARMTERPDRRGIMVG